jgi:hypothetical protein
MESIKNWKVLFVQSTNNDTTEKNKTYVIYSVIFTGSPVPFRVFGTSTNFACFRKAIAKFNITFRKLLSRKTCACEAWPFYLAASGLRIPVNCYWVSSSPMLWFFLSCKANARVYDAKSGHGSHSPPLARRLHLSAWQKSHTSSLRLSQSGLRTWTANQPSSLRLSQSGLRTWTANQPKFIPPIISSVPPRR